MLVLGCCMVVLEGEFGLIWCILWVFWARLGHIYSELGSGLGRELIGIDWRDGSEYRSELGGCLGAVWSS